MWTYYSGEKIDKQKVKSPFNKKKFVSLHPVKEMCNWHEAERCLQRRSGGSYA